MSGGGVLWGFEDGALINRICALTKEAPESRPLPSATCGNTKRCRQLRRGPRLQCWLPDLGLSTPRTVRSAPLSMSHSVCGTLLHQPMD